MTFKSPAQYEKARIERASLRREAEADVRRDGFISTSVALLLNDVGVDSTQLERDILDNQESI